MMPRTNMIRSLLTSWNYHPVSGIARSVRIKLLRCAAGARAGSQRVVRHRRSAVGADRVRRRGRRNRVIACRPRGQREGGATVKEIGDPPTTLCGHIVAKRGVDLPAHGLLD